MNDKDVLKYILGLGLEELVRRTGQTLEDVISGQNIPPQEEQVPDNPQAKTDNPAEDEEWARRFGGKKNSQ